MKDEALQNKLAQLRELTESLSAFEIDVVLITYQGTSLGVMSNNTVENTLEMLDTAMFALTSESETETIQ